MCGAVINTVALVSVGVPRLGISDGEEKISSTDLHQPQTEDLPSKPNISDLRVSLIFVFYFILPLFLDG